MIAFLLWCANNSNHFISKDKNFYPLKKKLIEKYGDFVGYDYQHIKEYCWTCNGTGMYSKNNPCYHCGGTGIHKEFVSILKKYKIGKYYFHTPIKRIDNWLPDFKNLLTNVTITGYIQHKGSNFGRESTLILLLLFDFPAFKREFGKILFKKPPFFPLSLLEWITFKIKHSKRRGCIKKAFKYKYLRKEYSFVQDDDVDLPF